MRSPSTRKRDGGAGARCTVPAVKLAPVVVAVALAGCASGEPPADTDGGTSAPDADPGAPDADPGAPDADPGAPDAGPVSSLAWRADTAAELGAAGHRADRAAIDPRGAIEPFAYYSGLVVRGSDTGVIGDPAATTWDQVLAMPTTSRIGIARGTDLQFGGAAPPGVGIGDGENWTVRVEGEVFLDAGVWTFTLEPDDTGFLEVDTGTGFTRVVNATWPTPASGTVTVTAPGWHPLRWTDCDTGGNASTVVRYRGPGVASAIPIPRDKLRVRADQVRGLVQTGFDDQLLVGASWSAIDQATPAHVDFGGGVPADLGIGDAEDWSSRWAGQLRIDVAGAYTFRYVSDDGQRLYVDGVLRTAASAWADTTQDQTTAAITLGVGWHDIVVDHSEHAAQSAARLTVATGPELAGQPLPLERLRPVEGRGVRFESAVNGTDVAIPAQGTATSTVAISAPAEARVGAVDVAYQFRHSFPEDLTISLVAPDGSATVLRNRVSGSSASTREHRALTLASPAAAGTWTLRVVDNESGDSGTIEDFALTLHYGNAGAPPIAPLAVYESPVHDLGAVTAIDRVSWEEGRPAETDVLVKMRTCAVADACAAAPWSAAMTDPAGQTPAVAVQRFAQYRVELVSNGDAVPSVEWVQVDYRAGR
jgi:subtilisin-like proprotein convertase family protein